MAGGRNKEATARTAIRSQRALRLRAQGHTYREIEAIIREEFEDETRYTFQSALKDCDRAMKQICVENSESLHMLREMEIIRLNYWLSQLTARIEMGDTDAINTGIKISNHRAKLMGLFAPVEVKIKTIVRESIEQELDAFFETLSEDSEIPDEVKERIFATGQTMIQQIEVAEFN